MPSWRSSRPSSTSLPDGCAGGRTDAAALAPLLASKPLASLATLADRHDGRVALVGGAVRDTLLGRPVSDLDLSVEGDLSAYLKAIERWQGRAPTSIGDRFQQTHRFRRRGYQVDVAAAQGSLEEDLRRRDFTVNAMAIRLSGSRGVDLLDPHGGRKDLDSGCLRETSIGAIAADPLRILRGVRYAAQLGFALEPCTHQEMCRRVADLPSVSAERVVAEWQSLLSSGSWLGGLELAAEIGVLGAVLGELGEAIAVFAVAQAGGSWPLRLAAVAYDRAAVSGRGVALDRLLRERWPPRQTRRAFAVATMTEDLTTADDRSLVGWVLDDVRVAEDASLLADCLWPGAAAQTSRLRKFCSRAGETRWVSGSDLQDWGMVRGADLGALLDRLARGQVSRRWCGAGEARAWARRMAAGGSS